MLCVVAPDCLFLFQLCGGGRGGVGSWGVLGGLSLGVVFVFFLCSYVSLLIFIIFVLDGPCQWDGLLWYGITAAALLDTCSSLWLRRSLALILLLVWPSMALASGLAFVLARVMPLV